MYPHVTQFETRRRELEQEMLQLEVRRAGRANASRHDQNEVREMLSYRMLSAYDEARLREQECAAMARLRFDRRERRWLRGRLDASRVLLARRERKLLDQNSVVVQVAAGGKLRAPSEHATRQFLLLEQGCAEMTAEGASARELTPGDLVGHAPGVTVRATTDLRVRVLTPREHDVVKTIPSLHGRTVEPLQRAA